MVINALDAKTGVSFRPYTILAAVENAIEGMKVGDQLKVTALLDATGEEKPRVYLNVALNKMRGNRRFTIRKADGLLAVIFRLPDVGDEEV